MIKYMIKYGISLSQIDLNLLRRFPGDQNLISDFIKGTLDVNHILIRGHNHISGMTEKVIDTLNQI